MASPTFGRVTAGITLATFVAVLGSLLPRRLFGHSGVASALESLSMTLGLAAWFLGVVYLLALLDPDIGLREALRSRRRWWVLGSIAVITAYVATTTVLAVALLACHGL